MHCARLSCPALAVVMHCAPLSCPALAVVMYCTPLSCLALAVVMHCTLQSCPALAVVMHCALLSFPALPVVMHYAPLSCPSLTLLCRVCRLHVEHRWLSKWSCVPSTTPSSFHYLTCRPDKTNVFGYDGNGLLMSGAHCRTTEHRSAYVEESKIWKGVNKFYFNKLSSL